MTMAKWQDSGFVSRMNELPMKALRKALKITQEDLADAAGISVSQVSKIENGEREPRLGELQAFAKLLNYPLVVIAEKPTVPLVGYVGASSEMCLYNEGQGPFGEARMPPTGTKATVAVEIRGDSLGSVLNGWTAYYDDRREPPTEDLHNELCVVALEDGRVLIKRLLPGRVRNRFDLYGSNDAPLLDQAVVWAARVIALLPK